MNIGNLVEYSGKPNESYGRLMGVVTQLSLYQHSSQDMLGWNIAAGCDPLVEVLWNTGSSWILQSRVRLIDEVG